MLFMGNRDKLYQSCPLDHKREKEELMECKKCGKEFEGELELCPACAEENLPEETEKVVYIYIYMNDQLLV